MCWVAIFSNMDGISTVKPEGVDRARVRFDITVPGGTDPGFGPSKACVGCRGERAAEVVAGAGDRNTKIVTIMTGPRSRS